MFPHKEEMYAFDEYGAVVDTSEYMKKDQDMEVEGVTTETINFSGMATSEGPVQPAPEPDKAAAAGPTKSISKVVKAHGLAKKGIEKPLALSAFLVENTHFNVPDQHHAFLEEPLPKGGPGEGKTPGEIKTPGEGKTPEEGKKRD